MASWDGAFQLLQGEFYVGSGSPFKSRKCKSGDKDPDGVSGNLAPKPVSGHKKEE